MSPPRGVTPRLRRGTSRPRRVTSRPRGDSPRPRGITALAFWNGMRPVYVDAREKSRGPRSTLILGDSAGEDASQLLLDRPFAAIGEIRRSIPLRSGLRLLRVGPQTRR